MLLFLQGQKNVLKEHCLLKWKFDTAVFRRGKLRWGGARLKELGLYLRALAQRPFSLKNYTQTQGKFKKLYSLCPARRRPGLPEGAGFGFIRLSCRDYTGLFWPISRLLPLHCRHQTARKMHRNKDRKLQTK